MSHYSKVKTKIKNKDSLVAALCDLGFTKSQIEVHDEAVALEGYEGRFRKEKANIIIRRRHVGGAANDIGFVRMQDGTYQAIISDYDRRSNSAANKNKLTKDRKIRSYNSSWLDLLSQRYAYHDLKKSILDNGLFIESEEEVDGEIFLEVSGGMFGG
jgi:hypothetical protein